MARVNLGFWLVLGLLLLGLHMVSLALAKALRTYSRSRLEELCQRHGRAERAETIAHFDERAERGCEGLAMLTGLGLAALLGMLAVEAAPRLAVESMLAIALFIGALGHVAAGVTGRVHAESVLDSLWPLATFLRRMMTPLTATARLLEAAAYRLARKSAAVPRPASVEVEIHSVPAEGPAEDIEADLPEATREAIEHAVDLARRDVAEMMTPWSAVLALPASASLHEAARVFCDSGHSRIPLYGVNRDDIVGILHVKDLFKAIVAGEQPPPLIRKLARPTLFVPETKHAYELLDEFRSQRTHLAIVLDEYGAVSGMVTLENLLEQIVGPIEDEHDLPPVSDPIVALGESCYEVDAAVPLEELNERLGLNLPVSGEFQTVGGLVFSALGHLPETGATFRQEGVEFKVVEVGEHSIRRLQLKTHPSEIVQSQ